MIDLRDPDLARALLGLRASVMREAHDDDDRRQDGGDEQPGEEGEGDHAAAFQSSQPRTGAPMCE